MNRIIMVVAAAVALAMPFCVMARQAASYDVVPVPQQVKEMKGKPFVLDKSVAVICPKGNSAMEKNAAMLVDYIEDETGLTLEVNPAVTPSKCIVLADNLKSGNSEAYTLKVTDKAVDINGASAAGCFYGMQTLRKSLPEGAEDAVDLPAVEISDAPRFGWRGAHLDVSRFFFPADSVKKYLDIMALHNMNRFHWHLTDDPGWRLPLKSHPELVTRGSVRRGSMPADRHASTDSIPYGGFYTPQEVRDIISYAADRHITVVPEIDLPGHMLSVLAAYPELGCTGGPYEVAPTCGIFADILCGGNDKVYEFLESMLTEVAEIFPSEYVHIGGDECPRDRWKACEKCQAKIAELGLKDDEHSSKEAKLQAHVMAFACDVLARHGKKVIGWDEILEGGAPANAAIMSWRGSEGGQKAAALGHDVVMTPNVFCYLDYYQAKDKDNEPIAIGGYVPLSKCFALNPFEGIAPENQKHILGVQGNVWTEFIRTFPHIQYMALPRFAALSEVQWSDPSTRNWDKFVERVKKLEGHYRTNGYNYCDHFE